MKDRKQTYILIGLFVILSFFVLIPHLSSHALFSWDESRVAANSMEMSQGGNILVPTFDKTADHWNTKPPLLIWIQALFIKLFSFDEWVVRLPSVLSVLAMGIGFILFFKRLGYIYTGFFASLVCLCTEGLYRHCFRSADYDALMICFVMLYLLSFLLYTAIKKNKYLILFFVFLTLATMTKGIQPLIPLPALLIYCAITKNLKTVLRNKYFYICAAFFVFIVLGYYLLRERYDNGYIDAVIANEITGRYGEVLEQHSHKFLWYFFRLRTRDFFLFLSLLPMAIFVNYFLKTTHSFQKTISSNRIMLFFLLNAVWYFLIISIGQTKCEWYVLPLIPMVSVVIGMAFESVLLHILSTKNKTTLVGFILAFCIMFSIPYYNIMEQNIHIRRVSNDDYFYCRNYIMRDIAKGKLNFDNIYYIDDNSDNQQSSMYYWHWMSAKGKTIYRIRLNEIKTGMIVQVNEDYNFSKIRDEFNIEELHFKDRARIIKIGDKKQ